MAGRIWLSQMAPGRFLAWVVVHEASGLNDNIRDICGRFAAEGYAALGVDLFEDRNRAVCMARMFVAGLPGNLDYYESPGAEDRARAAGKPPGGRCRADRRYWFLPGWFHCVDLGRAPITG